MEGGRGIDIGLTIRREELGGIVSPWTRFAVRPDAGCGGTVGADAARRPVLPAEDAPECSVFGRGGRMDSEVDDAGASCSAPEKAKPRQSFL